MREQIPATQRDIMLALPRRRMRFPRTQRELFELLTFMTPEVGLSGLLEMVDYTDTTPLDIILAVLGRVPGEAADVIGEPEFDPKQGFKAALLSGEFRQTIMPNLLHAFAEKGRDVFIHVPKCAGTDLIMNLAARHLPLPKLLEIEGWLSDEAFLLAVGAFVRLIPEHERIFVHGHMELGGYVYDAGVRTLDRIFTVIRDPLDLMLSAANYAIGRLRQDPNGRDRDSAEILQCLGIPRLPDGIGNRDLKDLATRALLHPEITPPNRACTYLGRGTEGTYAVAIDRLVVHNVEVTTTKQYDRWLMERWSIGRSEHHNRSEPVLSRNEVRWLYADALCPAIAEDQKLFDVVTWALEQTGKASVTGAEIGRMAGPWLLDGLPPGIANDARSARPKAGEASEPNLLVAEAPQAVDLHIQTARAASPDSPRTKTLLEIDFGENGTGRDYQLDGWSVTERTFTWTNAGSSRLQLPPLPDSGLCFLRLIGNPYVAGEKLPFQRIEVSINDEYMGAA